MLPHTVERVFELLCLLPQLLAGIFHVPVEFADAHRVKPEVMIRKLDGIVAAIVGETGKLTQKAFKRERKSVC